MASEPLGIRPPSFVQGLQAQGEAARAALVALYRDHLELALDLRLGKSVDVPDADPPEED